MMGALIAVLTGIGAGTGAYWLLSTLGELAGRAFFFRRKRILAELQRKEEAKPFDPYGVEGVRWELWQLVGMAAGVFLAYLLLAERSPYLSVFGVAGVYAPRLVRIVMERNARMRVLAQVRDFVFLLRSGLAMTGGLRPALEVVLEHLPDGVLRERLRYHLDATFLAEEALEKLAEDLRSEELAGLLERVEAAREGGESFEAALRKVAEDVEEEMAQRAEYAVSEAPVRLLLSVMVLMFPPVLVVALYPVVARLLALLKGPGPAGW